MKSDDQALPSGFRYSGVACGIKPSSKLDLSLIVCDRPVVGAGVYTQNQIVAAPVVVSRSRTPSATIRAVVTSSGNANACTGKTGMKDAEEMCQRVASNIDCPVDQVPRHEHRRDWPDAADGLCPERNRQCIDISRAAASTHSTGRLRRSALQTRTVRRHSVRYTAERQEISIAAMAKGAGMICAEYGHHARRRFSTDAPLSIDAAQHTSHFCSREELSIALASMDTRAQTIHCCCSLAARASHSAVMTSTRFNQTFH